MTIFVAQFYIEAGASYPFSHHFQRLIKEEITERVAPSEAFVSKYGSDFDIIFNMSGKSTIAQPEVRGPTVFKKNKSVEYTIFLAFNKQEPHSQDLYRRVLRQVLDKIIGVLQGLQMDVSRLSSDANDIIERIVANPKMIRSA